MEDCQCTDTQKAEAARQAEVEAARVPPEKQTARIRIEKRGSRRVTLVEGLTASANDLPKVLEKLRARCGSGGTVKADRLEIQGDHRDAVGQQLAELGYRTKR